MGIIYVLPVTGLESHYQLLYQITATEVGTKIIVHKGRS